MAAKETFYPNSAIIRELTPDDFNPLVPWELKEKHKGEKMVIFFYCGWCGWCRKFKPVYEEIASQVGFMEVAAFNCALYEDFRAQMKNLGDHWVQQYPTVMMLCGGIPKEVFEGERTPARVIKALKEFKTTCY